MMKFRNRISPAGGVCCVVALGFALGMFASCGSNPSTQGPGGTGDTTDVAAGITLARGVTLDTVTGDISTCIMGCIDKLDYTCLAACTTDISCMMGCYATAGCFESAFTIAMTLTNATSSDLTVTIGAGTTFEPSSTSAQTMMVLQDEIITVAPGTHVECIPVYCLDSHLSAPSAEFSYAAQSSAVTDSCLVRVISLTTGKSITMEEAQKIQMIVWKCRDPDDSPTADDWAYLENL